MSSDLVAPGEAKEKRASLKTGGTKRGRGHAVILEISFWEENNAIRCSAEIGL